MNRHSRIPECLWTKQARTTLSSETLHIILFKILGRTEKILDYHFFHFRTLPVRYRGIKYTQGEFLFKTSFCDTGQKIFQFHFNRILSPSSPHSKRFSLKAFKDFAFRTDCVIECFVFQTIMRKFLHRNIGRANSYCALTVLISYTFLANSSLSSGFKRRFASFSK